VERYVAIFKLAGVSLLSLETESFALGRSLVGNDPSPILIADIGSLTTDLTVIEGGVPVLSRSIDVGGNTVTRAIASSMGIDEARAEQFKRDVGLGAAGSGGTGVGAMIQSSFAAVVNEMKYSLDLYQGQGRSKIEKILVTGGNAFLPDLPEFLTQSLGVKSFIANPWARVSYPKELAEILDQLSPRMGTAVGLAMREII
ncbi:MAG: pilus assembly protein PilM, partial [Candidatus Komeilibacteria bacterium]|nr:pilus assembly protein PilM [Candidatus Komeilibacteria bacterium]